MKFENTVEAINNTGIQQKDFQITASPHAFKVLSSSLYTDKPRAVLRELSCNAYDANVENGKEDTPIIIKLPDTTSPILEIIDEGKGMNRPTLETLYTTYFSSTKQGADNQIGGFGLGSKSPFALTDNFNVTSVTENGDLTTILAYLDNGVPKVMVTEEREGTNLPSGTTVRVTIDDKDFFSLVDVIDDSDIGLFNYWKTFPEISGQYRASYLEDIEAARKRNELYSKRDFHKIDNCVAEVYSEYTYGREGDLTVLYGNVQYTVPKKMQQRLDEQFKAMKHFRAVFKIPLTSVLGLSPSREFIEDTEHNYNLIASNYEGIAISGLKKMKAKIDKAFIKTIKILKSDKDIFHKIVELEEVQKEFKQKGEDSGGQHILNQEYIAKALPNHTNKIAFLRQWKLLISRILFPESKDSKFKYNYSGNYGDKDKIFNNINLALGYSIEDGHGFSWEGVCNKSYMRLVTEHGTRSQKDFNLTELMCDKKDVYIFTEKVALLPEFSTYCTKVYSENPNAVFCYHTSTVDYVRRSVQSLIPNKYIKYFHFIGKRDINEKLGLTRTGPTGKRIPNPIGYYYNKKGEKEPLYTEQFKKSIDNKFMILNSKSHISPSQFSSLNRCSNTIVAVIDNIGRVTSTKTYKEFKERNTILFEDEARGYKNALAEKVAVTDILKTNKNNVLKFAKKVYFFELLGVDLIDLPKNTGVINNILGKKNAKRFMDNFSNYHTDYPLIFTKNYNGYGLRHTVKLIIEDITEIKIDRRLSNLGNIAINAKINKHNQKYFNLKNIFTELKRIYIEGGFSE